MRLDNQEALAKVVTREPCDEGSPGPSRGRQPPRVRGEMVPVEVVLHYSTLAVLVHSAIAKVQAICQPQHGYAAIA